jgi:hypothetical protein
MTSKDSPAVDLSGFLDGIRSRNLAAIERNTTLQVSELQIRLHLLQSALEADPNTSALGVEIGRLSLALRNPDQTIVDRFTSAGTIFRDVLLANADILKANPAARHHVEWAVRRFVEAAELARQDRVTDVALSLGDAWRRMAAQTL